MSTKKIGIPFWKVGDNSFGSTINYIAFAEQYGEIVPLMPEHTLRTDLDLLILPGGADVDPLRYNETPGYFTGKCDVFKEHFDKVYLPQYIEAGIPIFAICRGMQSIGVLYNGKLIQHMSHETNDITKDPYTSQHDMLFTEEFTTIMNFTRSKALPVNSRHHQVIDRHALPNELKVLAVHKSFDKQNKFGTSDGSVEMIAHTELPIVGLQSHPEDFLDYQSITFVNKIIDHLITNKTSILK